MAYRNRFSFTGEILLPRENSTRPFVRKQISGKENIAINFGIKVGNNIGHVEQFDSMRTTIMTRDINNNSIEIDWEDRFDENIVNNVATYRRYMVNLGEDCGGRKEFITAYDMMMHLEEWLPQCKQRIVVTGDYTRDMYNGGYIDKFNIRNIYIASEDRKDRLGVTIDIFYNKNSLDKNNVKSDGKIYLNGYTNFYFSRLGESAYTPQTFVFNVNAYNEENEKQQKLKAYRMKYFETKSKTFVHIPWECVYLNGAETIAFDESMLTSEQKEQIELGIKTLSDFQPRGDIYGNRIKEFRLVDPLLTRDFAEGVIDSGITETEMQDFIASEAPRESLNEVIEKTEQTVKPAKADKGVELVETVEEEVDDDDLF